MCEPDTTIEIKNEEMGGVTGFGTEHQCKDWTQLMQWTKDWETYMQDPQEGHHRSLNITRHVHGVP